jgi:hypothetical protein
LTSNFLFISFYGEVTTYSLLRGGRGGASTLGLVAELFGYISSFPAGIYFNRAPSKVV